VHPQLPALFQHVHRTSTYAAGHHPVWPHAPLPPGPAWTHATCRCGWADVAESHSDARVLARHHRRYAAEHPAYLPGAALRVGDRAHQADATGTHVSTTGTHHGWALADGIGDNPLAAHAAGSAAATAASVAADRGARAGLLAATGTLAAVLAGDTVMVVAPLPPERGDGWDIAWVGDCRAYEYDPDAGVLAQLTVDHTYGQELRDSLAERYRDRPQALENLAAGQDHVVTSSVATPRGGEHRYFRRPPGSRLRSTVGARGRGLGWHVDTRGPGALVTAPGSLAIVHGVPVPYTVTGNLPVAILPGWLVTALTPLPPPLPEAGPPSPLPVTSRQVTAYVQAAVDAECRNVATATEGHRHITVFAAAAALGELLGNGWISAAAITQHLTDAARRHLGVADFDRAELSRTIRDGIAAGREHPRVLTDRSAPRPGPAAHARRSGYAPILQTPDATNKTGHPTCPSAPLSI
jgi:hypothetical protein